MKDANKYQQLRQDAFAIAQAAIRAVKPDEAVKRALSNISLSGNVYLVSVGKAAWQMAAAAVHCLEQPVKAGIVLTKYYHVMGDIPGVTCYEAGHPVPDENSYAGTEAILQMTANLSQDDTVLFLLSGGGSALFEKPLVDPDVLQNVTERMLAIVVDSGMANTYKALFLTSMFTGSNAFNIFFLPDISLVRKAAYQPDFTRAKVAGLSYAVAEAARKGDEAANQILEQAAEALVDLASSVIRHYEYSGVEVSLIGGLTGMGDLLVEKFHRLLEEQLPQCKYCKPCFSPTVGAALYVMHELEHTASLCPTFIENLMRGMEE